MLLICRNKLWMICFDLLKSTSHFHHWLLKDFNFEMVDFVNFTLCHLLYLRFYNFFMMSLKRRPEIKVLIILFLILEISSINPCMLFISSPCQRQCELLSSLGIRRLSSVMFSHFNLLLWNPLAKWAETW